MECEKLAQEARKPENNDVNTKYKDGEVKSRKEVSVHTPKKGPITVVIANINILQVFALL